MKPAISIFLCALLLFGCKKENPRPQWDVDVLGPLFKATIKMDNLLVDSLRHVAQDGAVTFVFEKDIYSTPVDSVFKIQDTTLKTIQPPIGIGVQLPPNYVFYTATNPVKLDLKGAELSMAIVKKGYARLTVYNDFKTKVLYTFTMPKALRHGNPADVFTVKIPVNAAPANGVVVRFDSLFDLKDYWLDMRGVSGQVYNQFTYTVEARTAPDADTITTDPADTIYHFEVGFVQMLPSYARGYLAQGSVSESGSKELGFGKMVKNGLFKLDSLSATITIRNNVGVDAQATITSMKSVNSRTGVTQTLTAPTVINKSINLNRAVETAPPSAPVVPPHPVIPSYYTARLDNTNSNILALIENLPDTIGYDVRFNLNPLGNVSGHNDFIYTDDLFNANLKVNFPLRFGASQLMFTDTQRTTITKQKEFDRIGDGTFTLLADNGFPMEFDLRIYLLDDNGKATDSLFVPGLIAAAPVDGTTYRVTGRQRSKISIPVDEKRKEAILNAPQMAFRVQFSTPYYPQVMQLYSDYTLDLKLIADAKYKVR